MRALAVTGARPSELAPGLPTIAASGLPNYRFQSLDAIFAPARTPSSTITRLNQEIVRALQEPNTKQTLFNSGVVTVGSTPEEFGAFMKASVAKWGKVIKDSKIRVN